MNKNGKKIKNTYRNEETKKYLKTRLKTIEGQIRGVSKMIDEDRYCKDILTQLLAISKSIRCISSDILQKHLATCVVEEFKNDNLDVIEEVMELIKRLD